MLFIRLYDNIKILIYFIGGSKSMKNNFQKLSKITPLISPQFFMRLATMSAGFFNGVFFVSLNN